MQPIIITNSGFITKKNKCDEAIITIMINSINIAKTAKIAEAIIENVNSRYVFNVVEILANTAVLETNPPKRPVIARPSRAVPH